MERYARQLPIIGKDGQERLSKARVFIAGAGGLGTVVSAYLALAGVGFIRIVDHDRVDESNLNRQILHWTDDIGRSKSDSIREKLVRMNPNIHIETFTENISPDSVGHMVQGCDVIIDALDNFSTRFCLNSAAIADHTIYIHGAVNGFLGQATTISPFLTPCLRCIFPEIDQGQSPPVIGPTCCFIGSVQANEAIKYLCGTGDLLTGKLILWDGMRNEVQFIDIERNPSCPDCHQEQ